MTVQDADQMKAQVESLNTEQIGALWRWIFRLYTYRLWLDTKNKPVKIIEKNL